MNYKNRLRKRFIDQGYLPDAGEKADLYSFRPDLCKILRRFYFVCSKKQ